MLVFTIVTPQRDDNNNHYHFITSADERSEQFTLLKGHYYVESDSHCYSLSLLIKTWLRRGYFHYLFFTQALYPSMSPFVIAILIASAVAARPNRCRADRRWFSTVRREILSIAAMSACLRPVAVHASTSCSCLESVPPLCPRTSPIILRNDRKP